MKTGNMYVTLLCAWLLAGVSSSAQVPGVTEAALGATAPKRPDAPVFRLGPGDIVQVRFFYNQELNEDVQIRPDGHISLQLVGDVEVRNLTVAEATSKLETLYGKFLKTPSVSLQTRQIASQKVYVGGEVNHPGTLTLSGRMTALDAVMEAGGIKHTGNSSTLLLIRKTEEGGPSLRKLSMKMPKGASSEAALMILQPYDVVLVSESKIARVDRWVDQNIRQLLPLSLSGGFTYLAGANVVP